MKFKSSSVDETIALGEKTGQELTGGEIITLVGDLGGGKTYFTKGLAKGLLIREEITSPTFVLERIYETPGGLFLHHFDFYRLIGSDLEIKAEVRELLVDPTNIIVIEWATNIPESIPKENLQIDFSYINEQSRQITLTAHGLKYRKLIERIKNDFSN